MNNKMESDTMYNLIQIFMIQEGLNGLVWCRNNTKLVSR